MNTRITVAILLFLLAQKVFGLEKQDIVLAVGATQTLIARGEVHFSNNKVLRAHDLGSKIRISGKSVGEVDILSKGGAYHVEVVKPDVYGLYTKLMGVTKQMRGVSLQVHSGQIQLIGELLRKSDWIKLGQIHSENSGFQFRAAMDNEIKHEMIKYFHQLIRSSELPPVELQLTPVAQISLSKAAYPLRLKYDRVLGSYGFVIEQNSSVLQLEPLVRVNILVAEVRKNLSRSLGIQFPGNAKASLLPNFQVPADGEGINAQINALETQGNGHLLAAPTLLCRSGKNAEFLAGGEIPIKIMNFKYHETTWKKYGVLLRVSPLADSTGRMSIALTTEVSMLDSSHSIDGVPALLTNRIESHFDLKKSRTIALSGLLKSEWFRNSDGLPWLSQIPVLGYLFSSKEYKNNETELIIFVTPEVIQPESLDEEES